MDWIFTQPKFAAVKAAFTDGESGLKTPVKENPRHLVDLADLFKEAV